MEDNKNVDELKDEDLELISQNDEADVVEQDSADFELMESYGETNDLGQIDTESEVAEASEEPAKVEYPETSIESDTSIEPEMPVEAESPIEEGEPEVVVNSKKKIKSNKSMSKKKKTIIAVTAMLCVVAIVLSIVLPVVFYCKPRIFVKSADQFVAGDKVGDMGKYFYVLDKNISCDNLTITEDNVYSIDLNKHSLSVDGDFVINSNREGALYIGTRKSDTEYTSKKASIKATNITINAPNMNVVIMADITCETMFVNSKTLKVASFMKGEVTNMDMTITAEEVRFSGNISGTATSIIDLQNVNQVIVESGVSISNTIQLTKSNLTVMSSATLEKVVLDEESKATISGTIMNAIVGGAQVYMQEGHSCNTYQDINTLVIYRDTRKSHLIKNCKNVIYVEKLTTPVDITVQEIDNRYYCTVASVKHASGYRCLINGVEVATQQGENNTKFDITDYVKDIGTYKIEAIPMGDFSEESNLTDVGHCTMYVDGDAASIDYHSVMTLQPPKNLRVNSDFMLEFDSVPYADYYMIFVDGVMVIREDLAATTEDLSNFVGLVGDHSIRVQAFSFNENINASSVSMISCSTTEAIEAVDYLSMSAILNSDHTAINATWQGTANGYEYIVYLQINGDVNSQIEVGRTSIVDETGAIIYTINFDELPEDLGFEYDPESDTYFDVIVVAAEHDYFTQSDPTSCRVKISSSNSNSSSSSAK
ncbi:MAG: hypothetical protein K2O95_07740 [Clostridia bacterium]|nr:hypothetical protein [Clostridia bacterium]